MPGTNSLMGQLPSQEWDRLQAIVKDFEESWQRGQRPALADYLAREPTIRLALLLELIHVEMELRLKAAETVRVEMYLRSYPELADHPDALLELIAAEYRLRQRWEADCSLQEYLKRFPQYGEQLVPRLHPLHRDGALKEIPDQRSPLGNPTGDLPEGNFPAAKNALQLVANPAPLDPPKQVGRYRIEKVLGEGGFGRVYLAYDDQLNRAVAIKVPRRERLSQPGDAELYLAEARVLASLDHPNIVPVHDVGTIPGGLCYVVSKWIEGCDLAAQIKAARPSHAQAAELVATVSEALHYAHRKGLVHRDIKPANILLDTAGIPVIVDFGLALKEENVGQGPKYAGTPLYMSPEQARGEGHRVDGRSDIFSLGVVLYELLTGRLPFHADSQQELLEQITTQEPRPPRMWDDVIPKELERICLKALAKRAVERYTTAKDMGDDLRHFLAEHPGPRATAIDSPAIRSIVQPPATMAGSGTAVTPATPISDSQPVKIVPKGLRSFDAHDADFFLELLPGPRDRDGLPDSIRFWKTRIEESDAEQTFSVGLIYGPSGCGKSSLVKAGLLPRLASAVIAVYVEATAEDTEMRLLNGLRKRCPTLSEKLGLKETLATLRRGQGFPVGKKVVIILDQFEQWLHAKKEDQHPELVQALRQCDGGRVQCIVMVRDDFWMAATRFMRDLEVRLLEAQNSAAVDLFPIRHAEKVLAGFGRAFGILPDAGTNATREQKQFIELAVSGLAEEGKVVCVRLALFAEMMKGSKTWTPATLKDVGGTEGVGVTFLKETFSAATAPPEHRYHQRAAKAVLKSLLPESGTDIKGHMRSHAELLTASGYAHRPKEFKDLLHLLNSEIRLITPTDPEGHEEGSVSSPKAGEKYYQLTHDYLVPALREWLTREQRETWGGRAELLLADQAVVWNGRPENRQLPSLAQWFRIRCLVPKKNWTPPQRKMMQKAGRYHAVRSAGLGLLLVAATAAGFAISERVVEQRKATQAAMMVRAVLNADTAQVPAMIGEMAEKRKWIDPLLREEYDKAAPNSRQKLHASLALLPADPGQVDYLYGRLLDAEPSDVLVIQDFLAPHKDALVDRLWAVVETPIKGKESQRLRAAAALAKYDPQSERWGNASVLVVNDLVRENPIFLGQWRVAFRPVKKQFFRPLRAVYHQQQPERAAERNVATNLLADYAAEEPQLLADLLMDADVQQFAIIYPVASNGVPVAPGELPARLRVASLLTEEIDRTRAVDVEEDDKEKGAKRLANAGVALLKMNQPEKVWPLLKHSPDPRARSYMIHRLSPLGVDAKALVRRVEEEPDITIQRALLLSLGEYSEQNFSLEDRKAFLPKLQELYRKSSDAGLHAASEWLLRKWNQEAWLKTRCEEWAKNEGARKSRLENIEQLLLKDKEKAPPQWYVNGQGQTMAVIPDPVEYLMGSPKGEAGRFQDETLHRQRIGRSFVISTQLVTVEQYLRFRNDYDMRAFEQYAPVATCPVVAVNWYMAAEYCNWLSEQEGLPEREWCYERNAEGKYAEGMKPAANFLKRRGYRLPTEVEWEYACRAGAKTSRYYGQTDELLVDYGWYVKNSEQRSWPVGSLKPNDFGLFDMHGNTWQWCHDTYAEYKAVESGAALDDEGDLTPLSEKDGRVLRGGGFYIQPWNLRSASRAHYQPSNRSNPLSFRVAKTYFGTTTAR